MWQNHVPLNAKMTDFCIEWQQSSAAASRGVA